MQMLQYPIKIHEVTKDKEDLQSLLDLATHLPLADHLIPGVEIWK
jgi:hypothetical protein